MVMTRRWHYIDGVWQHANYHGYRLEVFEDDDGWGWRIYDDCLGTDVLLDWSGANLRTKDRLKHMASAQNVVRRMARWWAARRAEGERDAHDTEVGAC